MDPLVGIELGTDSAGSDVIMQTPMFIRWVSLGTVRSKLEWCLSLNYSAYPTRKEANNSVTLFYRMQAKTKPEQINKSVLYLFGFKKFDDRTDSDHMTHTQYSATCPEFLW